MIINGKSLKVRSKSYITCQPTGICNKTVRSFKKDYFMDGEGAGAFKRSPVSLFITKVNKVAICNFMEDGAI